MSPIIDRDNDPQAARLRVGHESDLHTGQEERPAVTRLERAAEAALETTLELELLERILADVDVALEAGSTLYPNENREAALGRIRTWARTLHAGARRRVQTGSSTVTIRIDEDVLAAALAKAFSEAALEPDDQQPLEA